MEILNPHSKNRYPLDKRIRLKLTQLIILICEKYPKNTLSKKNLSKRILRESPSFEKNTNNNVEMKLISINIIEMIEKEQLGLFEKGISKLFQKTKSPFFSSYDKNKALKRINKFSTSINLRGWSNIGPINIPKNHPLSKYVDSIELSAHHFSGSLTAISVDVNASDKMVEEIESICLNKIRSQGCFNWPRLNKIIQPQYWGYETTSNEGTKKILLEDKINELKFRILKYLSQFIPLYFTNNNILAPSLNMFNTNIKLKDENSRYYLAPLGVKKINGNSEKNGKWKLFLSEKSEFNNHSIISNIDTFPKGILNKKSYLMSLSEEVTSYLYPVLIWTAFLNNSEKEISNFRNNAFKLFSKSKYNYRKLLKIRLIYEGHLKILTSILGTIHDEDTEFNLNFFNRKFISKHEKFPIDSFPNKIEYIKKSYTMLKSELDKIGEIIDNNLKIVTIKENYKISQRNLILTTITTILAFISVYIAYIALNLTNNEIKIIDFQDVLKSFRTILNLFNFNITS
ncbi:MULTISPECIES: hypothetical protein [Psychrilyobacter]|uniref:Uncharacterized protein n=1 Tax=Psychrilyobacter piezotolerans TaxID=2293438 RepID=A0ABX9KDN9_9FUSO|nr:MULTISPECIES: hypothetical protein [Psychrilyobacter]MCS5423038.1 hypothetical protein [Psychrilyobacter sp. S5]NDI79033.1 hypothetical protein [Psychrilyobacter piezotolerans]RDE59114.1 hypothetical protein DV867_13895 [Psychrilyobacter sp. S5]REI39685.1 hypothetical protein DYH56_13895 [Psychrilyobacter piezotolerans]